MSDAEISLAFSLLGTEQVKASNNSVVQSLNNVKASYERVKKGFEDARKFSVAAAMVSTVLAGNGGNVVRNIAEGAAQIGSFALISKVISAIPGIGPVIGTAMTVIASTFMGEVVSSAMNTISEAIKNIIDYLQPSASLSSERVMGAGTNRMRNMREQIFSREQQIRDAGESISFVWGRNEQARMREELNRDILIITNAINAADAKAEAALAAINYDRRR